jgi:hypothetical protein
MAVRPPALLDRRAVPSRSPIASTITGPADLIRAAALTKPAQFINPVMAAKIPRIVPHARKK